MTFTESELVWHTHEDIELMAVHYAPDEPSNSWLIDVHGGAWSSGHRKSGRYYNRELAALGHHVFAIDFRQGPDHKHPDGSADVAHAVRYVRSQFNPGYLGLVGSSSGGHLALLAGLFPDIEAHQDKEDDTDTTVDSIIALWPVSNPLARFQYVNYWRQQPSDTWGPRFAPDRLYDGHLAYFGDTEAMVDATLQLKLANVTFEAPPRVMVVQPELDLNVPVHMSETLAGALLAAGVDTDYEVYPGVAHGFAHVEGEQTARCIQNMHRFLQADNQS